MLMRPYQSSNIAAVLIMCITCALWSSSNWQGSLSCQPTWCPQCWWQKCLWKIEKTGKWSVQLSILTGAQQFKQRQHPFACLAGRIGGAVDDCTLVHPKTSCKAYMLGVKMFELLCPLMKQRSRQKSWIYAHGWADTLPWWRIISCNHGHAFESRTSVNAMVVQWATVVCDSLGLDCMDKLSLSPLQPATAMQQDWWSDFSNLTTVLWGFVMCPICRHLSKLAGRLQMATRRCQLWQACAIWGHGRIPMMKFKPSRQSQMIQPAVEQH